MGWKSRAKNCGHSRKLINKLTVFHALNLPKDISIKLRTYSSLGWLNVLSVAFYILKKRLGYYVWLNPPNGPLKGPFFSKRCNSVIQETTINYFSYHKVKVTSPPDWFYNPWTNKRFEKTHLHWSKVPDFMDDLGDIKAVWELSRFDWLPRLAWDFRSGEKSALEVMENWVRHWCESNPPNCGINWKCGQEASLRCLNMLAASLLIKNRYQRPYQGFLRFLEVHLERIETTLAYAKAQDNNHCISEACALYVAGNYLSLFGGTKQKQRGRKWAYLGKKLLEDAAQRLILNDGSFSQHSLTYHRMILDELSFVELFRRKNNLSKFNNRFYKKAILATKWLKHMIDIQTGDGPNIGANDGTYLFNFSGLPYRDFRPSLQLALAVFKKENANVEQQVNPLMEIFDINTSKLPITSRPESILMSHGGYACIRHSNGFAVLRLPKYRFRPAHSDALHIDIWHKGTNWTRDSGTYSYNAGEESIEYFPGTSSHSTIQFDGRDQMPRLGRFLFGSWLNPEEIVWREKQVKASYRDCYGAYHSRTVTWQSNSWEIVDEIAGFDDHAIIYWHLPQKNWYLENANLYCNDANIRVESDTDLNVDLRLMPESRYYLYKTDVPVLRVKCFKSGKVKTIFSFRD